MRKRRPCALLEQGFREGRHASTVFPADTANVIDIEDRNQAEKEFSKLLDILPQYQCVYGADEKPLYANDSLLKTDVGGHMDIRHSRKAACRSKYGSRTGAEPVLKQILIGPVLYGVSMVLCFVSVWISLAIYLIVPLIYIFPGKIDRHWRRSEAG